MTSFRVRYAKKPALRDAVAPRQLGSSSRFWAGTVAALSLIGLVGVQPGNAQSPSSRSDSGTVNQAARAARAEKAPSIDGRDDEVAWAAHR